MNHRMFRLLINWWPPFRGAGIRLLQLSPDYSHALVELHASRWKRNYVGTHFGGSLYAMTDPFYMLMLLHQLGHDYWVWDLSAKIEYLTAAKGPVRAHFRLLPDQVDALREKTAGGDKVCPEFMVEILDDSGTCVARVHRTLYVRLKKHRRPANPLSQS